MINIFTALNVLLKNMLNFKTRRIQRCFKKVGFWIVCVFSFYFARKIYDYHLYKCHEGHSAYRIPVNVTVPTWESLNANIHVTGLNNTAATNAVAVVVPYRDRDSHLRLFLQHMHPFLQKQKLEYRIYVIEQTQGSLFNRAMLMNIGFVETLKMANYGGYVFHDVDLLPRDSRISYGIPHVPTHMSAGCDKSNYKDVVLFGGVTSFSTDDFLHVNGFSNQYYGWGSEDSDLYIRLIHSGLGVARYDRCIGQYNMMLHESNRRKTANLQRYQLVQDHEKYKDSYKNDGLNTLKHELLKVEHHKLFTRILVDIPLNRPRFSVSWVSYLRSYGDYFLACLNIFTVNLL